jgi:hypothetical protein
VIDPIALIVGSTVVVPDLVAGDGAAALDFVGPDQADEITAAVVGALALLAEAAHRGLRHLPATFPARLGDAARTLTRIGLRRAGAAVENLASSLGADPGSTTVTAWVDAQIRLLVTADSGRPKATAPSRGAAAGTDR